MCKSLDAYFNPSKSLFLKLFYLFFHMWTESSPYRRGLNRRDWIGTGLNRRDWVVPYRTQLNSADSGFFFIYSFFRTDLFSDFSVLPTKRERLNGTEDMAGMGIGPPVSETLVDAVDIPESPVRVGSFFNIW